MGLTYDELSWDYSSAEDDPDCLDCFWLEFDTEDSDGNSSAQRLQIFSKQVCLVKTIWHRDLKIFISKSQLPNIDIAFIAFFVSFICNVQYVSVLFILLSDEFSFYISVIQKRGIFVFIL